MYPFPPGKEDSNIPKQSTTQDSPDGHDVAAGIPPRHKAERLSACLGSRKPVGLHGIHSTRTSSFSSMASHPFSVALLLPRARSTAHRQWRSSPLCIPL